MATTKISLQQLIQIHGEDYAACHTLLPQHYRVIRQLGCCRTAALGGHASYCANGHLNGIWYNSCHHRFCPQCRGLATERWLASIEPLLLDCPHHHMIFTFPNELNELWRFNRELMGDLLFASVRETLKTFSDDPRYLKASPGILSVLHTWGRNLSLHPHVHVLISHGGLNDAGKWVEPKKSVLFPQKPLMMVFRGKLLSKIRAAMAEDKLILPTGETTLTTDQRLSRLTLKDWVVHCCPRYDHAKGVAKYLSRYVKRGPMRNQQLRQLDSGLVSFSYQSHQTKQREYLRLKPEVFLERLLEHVPLTRKPMVRYGGLYSNSSRGRLNQARKLLGQESFVKPVPVSWHEYLERLGVASTCKVCGEPLLELAAVCMLPANDDEQK